MNNMNNMNNMNIINLTSPDTRNYIPDSVNDKQCSNSINTINSFYGPVNGPQRGLYNCPFGLNDDNIGVFFRENIKTNTMWGRVPQLDPRSISRIGMEYRN